VGYKRSKGVTLTHTEDGVFVHMMTFKILCYNRGHIICDWVGQRSLMPVFFCLSVNKL